MKLKLNHIFSKERLPNFIGIVIILLVVLTYYFYVFRFSVNIPYWDEFFVLNWFDSYINQTFWGKIIHLFEQANEHRLFSYRLTVFMQYLIFGDLNFRNIILFGNLGMIWLIYLLYKMSPFFKSNVIAFIPVILLLFVPQNEISIWGMVAIASIFEYALVFASLTFLNKQGYFNFTMSLLLAIIATFSFGNGMFVFFAGFIILLMRKQKPVIHITLWSLFMALSISLYFLNFNFSSGGGPSKFEILHHPINAILFFLTLIGNLFTSLFKAKLIWFYLSGFIVCASFCFIIIRKWSVLKHYPLLISYLVFLFLTAITITISRVGFGIGAATAPRYMLLPILFVVLIYIMIIFSYRIMDKKIIFLILIASLFLYFARMSQQIEVIRQHKSNLEEGLISYNINPNKSSLGFINQTFASNSLTNAIKKKYYNPPTLTELNLKKKTIKNINIIPATDDIVFYFDSIGANSTMIHIRGWAFLKEENRNEQRVGITLNSSSDTLFFETSVSSRPDVIKHFKNQYPELKPKCGFFFSLNWIVNGIPPGHYTVGISIINNEKMTSYKLSDKVLNLAAE
jgi:hypothetical protein